MGKYVKNVIKNVQFVSKILITVFNVKIQLIENKILTANAKQGISKTKKNSVKVSIKNKKM